MSRLQLTGLMAIGALAVVLFFALGEIGAIALQIDKLEQVVGRQNDGQAPLTPALPGEEALSTPPEPLADTRIDPPEDGGSRADDHLSHPNPVDRLLSWSHGSELLGPLLESAQRDLAGVTVAEVEHRLHEELGGDPNALFLDTLCVGVSDYNLLMRAWKEWSEQ